MYVIGRRILGGAMLVLLGLVIEASLAPAVPGKAYSFLDEAGNILGIVWAVVTLMYAALLIRYGRPQRWWAWGGLSLFAACTAASILRLWGGELALRSLLPVEAYLYTGVLFAIPALQILDILLPFRTEAPWKKEQPA